LKVSIGICAYNESSNIGKLLDRLVKLPHEIIVVASGCTDNTVPIVKSFKSVNLVIQKKREGKASAVNEVLKSATGDTIILQGADIIPSSFCYKYLLKPLEDKTVGMVGAHPIPVDDVDNLMGKIAHLLWNTHHQSALVNPKAGEVCAFRNIIRQIDSTTPVDEVSIEYGIVKQGYKVKYAPDAIVFNKGCSTIKDFLKQRKRIYYGHLLLKRDGYTVPTMSYLNLIRATLRATGKHYRSLITTVCLELLARRQAKKSFISKDTQPTIWEVSRTTKEIL